MKPRKPPFVLITVLTICLGTVAYVSMSYSKWTGAPEMVAPEPPKEVGDSRQAESIDQVAAEVSTKSDKSGQMPQNPKMMGPGGMGERPSIYRPIPKSVKPQPNESSVASGWFRDNYGGAGSK